MSKESTYGLYTPEFKRQVVDRVMQGDLSMKTHAKRFGVNGSTIKNWLIDLEGKEGYELYQQRYALVKGYKKVDTTEEIYQPELLEAEGKFQGVIYKRHKIINKTKIYDNKVKGIVALNAIIKNFNRSGYGAILKPLPVPKIKSGVIARIPKENHVLSVPSDFHSFY